MKSTLTKVSMALFSVVFLLSCQDLGSGPVGPDGLVPQFAKWTCDDRPDHPSCALPAPGTDFDVTIESSQFCTLAPLPDSCDSVLLDQLHEVNTAVNLNFEEFELNLAFFNDYTGCESLGTEVGTLRMVRGEEDGVHVHVHFSFKHGESGVDEANHTLSIEGVPVGDIDDWRDPTMARVVNSYASGYWTMAPKGKNHQNGCSGEEDGTPNNFDEVRYTITVALAPPSED